jgi:hypothetical protein
VPIFGSQQAQTRGGALSVVPCCPPPPSRPPRILVAMVTASAVLSVAIVLALLPCMIAAISLVASRCRHEKPAKVEDGKSEEMLIAVDGMQVSVSSVVRSTMRLRFVVTFTLLQLGWAGLSLSVVPMLSWVIGADGWYEMAQVLGSATAYLAFVPPSMLLMLLSIFPNDTTAQRAVLIFIIVAACVVAALSMLSLSNKHITDRPVLLVMNIFLSLWILSGVMLLLPALSDRIRCGTPRSSPLGQLFFPPRHFSGPDRLRRIWIVMRLTLCALGLTFIVGVLIQAFADIPHRFSTLAHPEFINGLALGGSSVLSSFAFSPYIRRCLVSLLGRQKSPDSSDKHAAHLSGFDDFYNIERHISEV